MQNKKRRLCVCEGVLELSNLNPKRKNIHAALFELWIEVLHIIHVQANQNLDAKSTKYKNTVTERGRFCYFLEHWFVVSLALIQLKKLCLRI